MAVMIGTGAADFLAGVLREMNEIYGLGDGDTILGGHRPDMLVGGDGDDLIWGDGGNDTIEGDAGYDVLFGSTGNDTINGGSENDYISGGKDDDVINAGDGWDVVNGNSGNDVIDGGADDDYLFGTTGNDTMTGGAGNDYIDGGSDDDTLLASEGSDSYIGGSGFDTIDFSAISGRVAVDVSKHTVSFTANGVGYESSVEGIERIVAGDGGIDAMGSKADEVYVGGAGDDWFRGKGGADVLTGGEGADTFVWLKKDATDGMAADVITDFEVGVDMLDLADFVKGGQDYADVVRFAATDGGVIVQGNAKGVWVDVVVLEGLDMYEVGADGHQMSLADIGLMV